MVAGVVSGGLTCLDQTMCNIIVYGPAVVNVAQATDPVVEDDKVSTSTVSGLAGDWGEGADSSWLGLTMKLRDVDSGIDTSLDNQRFMVFIDPGHADD